MCSFKWIYFVIFILNLNRSNGEISDKRMCADPECKEPVSFAKSMLRYSSPDPRILSFAPNVEVVVYSKEAGSETDLWGAEINGKRGYIPKHLVREYKIIKKPTLLVDTDLGDDQNKPKVPLVQKLEPEKVQEPYEVVDGTTIYLPAQEINPSTTEDSIQSTEVPFNSGVKEETKPLELVPKETEKEDNSVFSKLTNWMSDGNNSEEVDEDVEEDESAEDEEDFEDEDGEDEDIQEVSDSSAEKVEEKPLETEENKEIEKEAEIKETAPEVPTNEIAQDNLTDPIYPDITTYSLKTDDSSAEEVEAVVEDEAKPAIPQENENKTPDLAKIEETVEAKQEELKLESTENPVTEIPQEDVLPQDYLNVASVTQNPADLLTDSVKLTISEETPKAEVEEKLQPTLAEIKPLKTNFLQGDQKLEENVKVEGTFQNELPLFNLKQNIQSAENKIEKAPQPIQNLQQEETKNVETPEPIQANQNSEVPQLFPEIEENVKINPEEPQQDKNPEIPQMISEITPDDKINLEAPQQETQSSEIPLLVPELAQLVPEIQQDETKFPSIPEQIQDIKNLEDSPEITVNSENLQQSYNESQEIKQGDNKNQEELQQIDEENKISNNVSEEKEVELKQADGWNFTDQVKTENESSPYEDLNKIEKNIVAEQSIVENSSEEVEADESSGFFSSILSFFGGGANSETTTTEPYEEEPQKQEEIISVEDPKLKEQTTAAPEVIPTEVREEEKVAATEENSFGSFWHSSTKKDFDNNNPDSTCNVNDKGLLDLEFTFNSDVFLYLVTTAISVILFLFGYMALDKSKREGPLIARINKLEKDLLVTLKENEILQDKDPVAFHNQQVEAVPSELVQELNQQLAEMQNAKLSLEEQVQVLEKELDTSTEVGMELNRILTEMLSSSNGEDTLKANVEQLQRQLVEQQDTINNVNDTLNLRETENHELHLELEISNKKVVDLQGELHKMVDKILKIEEERDHQQSSLEAEVVGWQQKFQEISAKEAALTNEIKVLQTKLLEADRLVSLKTKEYKVLTDSLKELKAVKNNSNILKNLLDATEVKAELQQLQSDNKMYVEKLQQEKEARDLYERRAQTASGEAKVLREKYEKADKEKVETNTKLDVLTSYFKEKEAQLQKEISKYESMWVAKEGETTSTTERIKYMQEELQNYKANNETLKQEIISQEVELKSQISVLEKKVHENWLSARQTERKLQDTQQEAAQLRNRLTMRERAIHEEKAQNRLTSPLEQNGDMPLSPHPIESPASPPLLLYGARDHITKSPALPGLPPFLPPPGAPFMPPPPHGMPFMPPPPSMFPGDHRPPPLGRMSSPPLNSRYSPDSSAFSPYDRNSPSPLYDSEYGTSPPAMNRAYSPYSRDDRRERDRRPPHVRNGRNLKNDSSDSDHSSDYSKH